MKSRRLMLAAGAVGLLVMVAMQPQAVAQSEKTMSVAIGRITTFNPITAAGGYEYAVFRLIWGGVAVPTPEAEIVPDQIEQWSVSPDARTWTFTLRRGLKWSDGRPATAQDLVFTLTRALDRRTGSIWAGPLTIIEGAPAYVEGRAQTVSGIRQVDDLTVRVTLSDPNSALFVSGMVTHRPLPILPAHILGNVPPGELARHAFWNKPDVTLGPFVFVRYQPDQFLEVRANPNYWGPKAQVDRMILRITPTVDAAVAQVERGEVQITNIPALEAERLGKVASLRILKAPGTAPIRITFDHTKPYFKDRRVRQAFQQAIDREGLVKTVLQGYGLVPAHDILGPAWAKSDIKPYPFSPDRARALLREAGWDPNRRVTLSLIPGFRDRDLAVTIIQQQLRDVGVQMDIRQQDLGTVLRGFIDRSFDMYLYGGGNFRLDPDFVCLLYCSENFYPSGANLGHYSNERIDTLAGAGRRLGRTDLRARVYADLAKTIYDEVPNIWLYVADTVYAVQRNVTGFVAHTNYETMFWNGYAWGVSR